MLVTTTDGLGLCRYVPSGASLELSVTAGSETRRQHDE
jgi:hypothetical protein